MLLIGGCLCQFLLRTFGCAHVTFVVSATAAGFRVILVDDKPDQDLDYGSMCMMCRNAHVACAGVGEAYCKLNYCS